MTSPFVRIEGSRRPTSWATGASRCCGASISRSRRASSSRSPGRPARGRARSSTSSARSTCRPAAGSSSTTRIRSSAARRARRVPQRDGRLRVPEPPPAAGVHRGRERDDAGAHPARAAGGGAEARGGHARPRRPRRADRAPPRRAVRGRAAARRARAGAVPGAALLLADEPTGNLDPATAEGIHALLADLNAKMGITAVVVTHNERLASALPRRLRLELGRLA